MWIPGEQSFWCEFFTRERAGHHGSILWFCFSLIIYSTNNDQNYFLCLLFIIFSGLISQWPQSSLDSACYRAACNRNSQSRASCATAWQSAVPFFFVPYRLPGIGFIISCTRPVLSLDSLWSESPHWACRHSFFAYENFYMSENFSGIYFSQNNMHFGFWKLRRRQI